MIQRDQRAYFRDRIRAKRAAANAAGVVLPSDSWAADNPEKHAEKTARWRSANPWKAGEIARSSQATRRSTPWGKITNRIWPIINDALRRGRDGGGSKYCEVLGYTWFDLKFHLQSQFLPGMCWDNWGEVWEIDHIKPISGFRYDSIEHPDFLECWALANLRPLWRGENARKFNKAT